MKAPIWWFGGKGLFVSTLLEHIPKHKGYVEVFGGGASLLFAKDRSESEFEVYNDIDEKLVNFFRVLRNREQREELLEMLAYTPEARAIKQECWRDRDKDDGPVMAAYRLFVILRQGFSGKYDGSWGHRLCKRSDWVGAVRKLPEVCNRMDDVQIENETWEVIIDRYDEPDTFFYLDPPYVPDTRRSGKYPHEMTAEEHEALIGRLYTIEGKALLSGYKNNIYDKLGWERKDFEVACSAVGKTRPSGLRGEGVLKEKQMRTESLWLNYDADLQLAFA